MTQRRKAVCCRRAATERKEKKGGEGGWPMHHQEQTVFRGGERGGRGVSRFASSRKEGKRGRARNTA